VTKKTFELQYQTSLQQPLQNKLFGNILNICNIYIYGFAHKNKLRNRSTAEHAKMCGGGVHLHWRT